MTRWRPTTRWTEKGEGEGWRVKGEGWRVMRVKVRETACEEWENESEGEKTIWHVFYTFLIFFNDIVAVFVKKRSNIL